VRHALEPSKSTQMLIPTGKHKVIVDHSNRFNRDLPLLLNVAGFTGVRIHRGNTTKDTLGCILPGKNDKIGWGTVILLSTNKNYTDK
jgi:hypothetical protein